MNKITKILLAVSLTAFSLGFTNIFWGFGNPAGAICFGLFMIFKVLEKETALYDQEQALHLAEATQVFQGSRRAQRSPAQARDASLIAAAAHSP